MNIAIEADRRKKRVAAPAQVLTLSHSSLRTWAECRERFRLKYLEQIEPQAWPEEPEALLYGRLFDTAIARWLWGEAPQDVLAWLDSLAADGDRIARARAMLCGYWRAHGFAFPGHVVGVQVELLGPITNPATGAAAKLAELVAILDALFLDDAGRLWVYELKTTGRLDGPYVDGLWLSPQTGLYALYAGRALGVPVAGVLYDVAAKPPGAMRQRAGESEEAYYLRTEELARMNKTGKTSAKRQAPETDSEWHERLVRWHAEPGRYLREEILIDSGRLRDVEGELWRKTQDYIAARQRGLFYRNDSACRAWGRECEYLPICQAGEDAPAIIENLFRRNDRRNNGHNTELNSFPFNTGTEANATVVLTGEPMPF